MDKFHRKLASWKGSLLNQASKVQLLKSTLKSIPLYVINLFRIPAKFVEAIEKIQRTFLWTGVEEKKRMNLIAWDKVCKPIRKGGLRLRRIRDMNEFLMAKQIWRGYNTQGEWKLIWDNKYKRQYPTLLSFLNAEDIPIGSNI